MSTSNSSWNRVYPVLVTIGVGAAAYFGHDFYFANALPFVSYLFFLFLFSVVVLTYCLRERLGRCFETYIFALNLFYCVFLFPKPVLILAFGVYFYAVYFFLCVRPAKKLLGQALIMAILPMILARSTNEIRFVGLSYITFRAFHLMMDSHLLGKLDARRFFTFLTFFPTVTAGPIDRMQNFGRQLGAGSILAGKIEAGYKLLLTGACMKFVFAEAVQKFVLGRGWLGELYGYPLFLYFDFAGYSAMAIGCALMLGIVVPDNFDKPFLSQNSADFWRRFHITLGAWLKDFFFTPIYKSFHGFSLFAACPLLRQNVALFLTFLLMGCWNGLKLHFVFSGVLFGVYSVVYNSYLFWRKRRPPWASALMRVAAIFVTVNCACFALYVFSGRWR